MNTAWTSCTSCFNFKKEQTSLGHTCKDAVFPIFSSMFDENTLYKEFTLYLLSELRLNGVVMNKAVFPMEMKWDFTKLCKQLNDIKINMFSTQNINQLPFRRNCPLWQYPFTFKNTIKLNTITVLIPTTEGIPLRKSVYTIHVAPACVQFYMEYISDIANKFSEFLRTVATPEAIQVFEQYTDYSNDLNKNTISGFITSQYNDFFNMSYRDTKQYADYTVGFANWTILNTFEQWATRERNGKYALDASLNSLDSLLLYSGGPLLCDQLGTPLTVNKSICLMTHLSTSTCRGVALEFTKGNACLYTINVQKKHFKYLMPLAHLSCAQEQYEVILPLGTILEINLTHPETYENGIRFINLQLVDYDMSLFDTLQNVFKSFRVTVGGHLAGGNPGETHCTHVPPISNIEKNQFVSFANAEEWKQHLDTISHKGGVLCGKYSKSPHYIVHKKQRVPVYIGKRGGWYVRVDNEYKRVPKQKH